MKFDVGILANQPVPEIVRQVRLAEALGYETAGITDTHLVCRELWVTLTACALGTTRMKLGPGVIVPHTRHLSVTASAILTLEKLRRNASSWASAPAAAPPRQWGSASSRSRWSRRSTRWSPASASSPAGRRSGSRAGQRAPSPQARGPRCSRRPAGSATA